EAATEQPCRGQRPDTPRLEGSSGGGCAVAPGEVFVVELVAFEAGMEDADPAVGELAEGLAVALVPGSELVVVGAGAGGGGERAERPLLEGVGEASGSGVAGHHDEGAARGSGDRGAAGEVLARLGGGEAGSVITELAQHPGAEDRPQSW